MINHRVVSRTNINLHIFFEFQKRFVQLLFQMEIFHKIVKAESMKRAMISHVSVGTKEMKKL